LRFRPTVDAPSHAGTAGAHRSSSVTATLRRDGARADRDDYSVDLNARCSRSRNLLAVASIDSQSLTRCSWCSDAVPIANARLQLLT
jgi:hypothetical protein